MPHAVRFRNFFYFFVALLSLTLICCPALLIAQSTSPDESAPTLPPENASSTVPANTPAGQNDSAPHSAPTQRPRIGLALSGGGALGLAEIGVIQWLEENHIPVDRIAGTSMGGIIGSMYASGMSPAEIKTFAAHIDWDQAFVPEPQYSQLSYRRKQDRRDYLVGAAFGLKHGLGGPNGFNSGHEVGLLLDRISLLQPGIKTFDDLPIPFRCVATDMASGDAVVLKDGSLARAVRASMAIPGVFTPVEIDGHILADGGMVQNIPVEVVRTMGVDHVIAVQLNLPPGVREQLESLTGVLTRAVSIMIMQNERHSIALADATVTVQMGRFLIDDYNQIDDIVHLGYQTAADQSAQLLPYAIRDDAEWQQYLAEREARKRPPLKEVKIVKVEGGDRDEDRRLENELTRTLSGPLDLSKLDTELTRIAGRGQFDRLGYEGFTQNGVPGIRVTAHEKSYGPPFIDFAINVDVDGIASSDFSAGARVTFMDVDHRGGEWRNDVLFGTDNLAATEFYQPLAMSHFFVAPYAFASKFSRNSFSGETRVAVFGDERAGGGFDFGYNSGLRSELRFGYEIYSGRLAPLVGSTGLPTISGSTGEFRVRYVWDGQDNPAVPSTGTRFVTTFAHVLQSPGDAHSIEQAEMQASKFIPTSRKTSIFLATAGGTTIGGDAGPFQIFGLGGPFRLGAYLPQEFLGNHYAYGSFGFRREFYRLPQLVGKNIYWAGWYEAGTAFNDPGPVVVHGSVNLGVIAETIVGPITIAGSVGHNGQSRVNFSIGKLF